MSADFSGWPLDAVCYNFCIRASLWFIFHMLMTGGKWFAVTFDSNHQTAMQSIEAPLVAIRAVNFHHHHQEILIELFIHVINEMKAMRWNLQRDLQQHLRKMSLLQIKPCHIHAKPNIISTIRKKNHLCTM